MSSKLLAAIEAVLAQLPQCMIEDGRVWIYQERDPDSGFYAATPAIDDCEDYYLDFQASLEAIAALMNAAPGMLDEARRCIENSQLVLSYQTHDDVYTAVRAMLRPLFAQYAHLPAVQALEVKE